MVSRIDSGGSIKQANQLLEKTPPEDMEVLATQVRVIAEKVQHAEELPVDQAKRMTDSMNKFLESANTQLRFKFHDKLNEYYVTIVDTKTDEVVREIPSKKLLDIHAAMREFVGLLVDRKI